MIVMYLSTIFFNRKKHKDVTDKPTIFGKIYSLMRPLKTAWVKKSFGNGFLGYGNGFRGYRSRFAIL